MGKNSINSPVLEELSEEDANNRSFENEANLNDSIQQNIDIQDRLNDTVDQGKKWLFLCFGCVFKIKH